MNNAMGNEINFSMSDNSLELTVSCEPVYMVVYKKVANANACINNLNILRYI